MSRKRQSRNLILLSASVAASIMLVFAGCATRPTATASSSEPVLLKVRDTIILYVSKGGAIHEQTFTVNEDGTVTLPLSQTFVAAGKTLLNLQKEIHERYSGNGFSRLSVVVRTGDQFYTMTGNVAKPGQFKWSESLTVTKVIQAGGDLNRSFGKPRVILIRANGEKMKVDLIEALKDPSKDPQVLPGDIISFPRRGPFGP